MLKQLHGSFMVIAWLMAASTGLLMPRYMKKTWVGKQFMKKDLWFVVRHPLHAVQIYYRKCVMVPVNRSTTEDWWYSPGLWQWPDSSSSLSMLEAGYLSPSPRILIRLSVASPPVCLTLPLMVSFLEQLYKHFSGWNSFGVYSTFHGLNETWSQRS